MAILRPPLIKFSVMLAPLVLLCGGAFLFGKYFTITKAASAPVSVRPFVLDLAQVNYADDPAGKAVLNHLVLRRRDGTEALVAYAPGDQSRVIGRRVNGIDGRIAGIFDGISSVMSGWITPKALAQKKRLLMEPPPQCAWKGESVAGKEQIAGHSAWRVVREAPGSSRRWTEWRLEEFSCAMVRQLQEQREPDGRWRRIFEAFPLSFAEADPDPAVFSNWENYSELPPSEIRKRLYQRAGVTPDKCPGCFQDDARVNGKYFEMQSRP